MKKVTKEDIEKIIDRKLLDFEYEAIIYYLKAFREGKKLIVGRSNNKTKLTNEAIVLNGILPEKVIFDEFLVRED